VLQAAGGPAVGALLSDLGGLGMPIDEAFAHRALQTLSDFQTSLSDAYPRVQNDSGTALESCSLLLVPLPVALAQTMLLYRAEETDEPRRTGRQG
jgi:hypothetical protein